MQSTHIAVTGPLFATVSFVGEGSELNQAPTFRVPISETTTVRRLAKDALSRLQLHERANGREGDELAVSEVVVGEQRAQLFVLDIVVQVVSVATERIFVVLRAKPSKPDAPRDINSSNLVAAPAKTSELPSSAERKPLPLLPSFADRQQRIAEERSRSPERVNGPGNTSPSRSTRDRPVERESTHAPASTKYAPTGRKPLQKRSRTHEVTSQVTTNSDAHASPVRRHHRRETGSTPEAYKFKTLDDMSPEEREKFIAEKTKEGWGPSSFQRYEVNYVSDPEKLARQLRKQKQKERESSSGPKEVCTVPREVACYDVDHCRGEANRDEQEPLERKLFLADQLMAVEMTPVAEPSAALPEGWGCDATKYFDPRTYHANPSKAHIDEAVLREPIRPRRLSNYTF